MTTRYDIGFGRLKGPDLIGLGGLAQVEDPGDTEATSLFVPGASLCTYSSDGTLPDPAHRRPGDQHVARKLDDEAVPYYEEYVAVGETSAYFYDGFDRPDSTAINTQYTRWVQSPQGFDDAWWIIGNRARSNGQYRTLAHPFGPYDRMYVHTVVDVGSSGTPGVFSNSLEQGGQTHGYFAQVRLSDGRVTLKRGGTIVAQITISAPSLPLEIGIEVERTTATAATIRVKVGADFALSYAETAYNTAHGGWCGIGQGDGTGDAFFRFFQAEELGAAIEWAAVGQAGEDGEYGGGPGGGGSGLLSDQLPLGLFEGGHAGVGVEGSRWDHRHDDSVDGWKIYTRAGGTIEGLVDIEDDLVVRENTTLKKLVTVGPNDGVNDGGRVRLAGAGPNSGWDVANNAGFLRFVRISDGAEIFTLDPSTSATGGVKVLNTKFRVQRTAGEDKFILDPSAPHARTGDLGWGQATFPSETLSGDALIDGTVTSLKLSPTALVVGAIPTGTANSSRGRFLRHVASDVVGNGVTAARTLDTAGQNIDGLRTANGAVRVADGAAYGGFCIRRPAATSPNTIMMQGPFYGSDSGDYAGSPGLVPGLYKATVYVKAGSTSTSEATALTVAVLGGAGIILGTPLKTWRGVDLATSYTGYSILFTVTADTRGTSGLEVRVNGHGLAELSISHVRVESYQGPEPGEIVSFIRAAEITSAQIANLSATKLVAGTIETDDIGMGAAGMIWFGQTKTGPQRMVLKGGGTDPARGLFAYRAGTEVVRLSADGTFQLRGLPTGPAGSQTHLSVTDQDLSLWKGTSRMVFLDGTTGNVVLEGTIYARAGEIGGFSIADSRLHVAAGTTAEAGVSGAGWVHSAFWAGGRPGNDAVTGTAAAVANAKFRVTKGGYLTATDGVLTGTLDVTGTVRAGAAGNRVTLEQGILRVQGGSNAQGVSGEGHVRPYSIGTNTPSFLDYYQGIELKAGQDVYAQLGRAATVRLSQHTYYDGSSNSIHTSRIDMWADLLTFNGQEITAGGGGHTHPENVVDTIYFGGWPVGSQSRKPDAQGWINIDHDHPATPGGHTHAENVVDTVYIQGSHLKADANGFVNIDHNHSQYVDTIYMGLFGSRYPDANGWINIDHSHGADHSHTSGYGYPFVSAIYFGGFGTRYPDGNGWINIDHSHGASAHGHSGSGTTSQPSWTGGGANSYDTGGARPSSTGTPAGSSLVHTHQMSHVHTSTSHTHNFSFSI